MSSFLDQTAARRKAAAAVPRPVPEFSSVGPRKAWLRQAQDVSREVEVIWLVFKDPRTPWYARLVAASAVGYVFSPIQLIPSFIPVIGFLDDFIVLAAGFRAVRKLAGEDVIRNCRERATAAQALSKRDVRRFAGPVAAIIAGIWLLATVVATLWLYR